VFRRQFDRSDGPVVCVLTTACECDSVGSSSPVCDVITGQCPCLHNVAHAFQMNRNYTPADTHCSNCRFGSYGLAAGRGCTLCKCNLVGTMWPPQCSEEGVCRCRYGITGKRCTRCRSGFHRFSSRGCS